MPWQCIRKDEQRFESVSTILTAHIEFEKVLAKVGNDNANTTTLFPWPWFFNRMAMSTSELVMFQVFSHVLGEDAS